MKTQTQEIERLNQIERQKELIAQLSEMRQNIDLPPRVMDDLLWASVKKVLMGMRVMKKR